MVYTDLKMDGGGDPPPKMANLTMTREAKNNVPRLVGRLTESSSVIFFFSLRICFTWPKDIFFYNPIPKLRLFFTTLLSTFRSFKFSVKTVTTQKCQILHFFQVNSFTLTLSLEVQGLHRKNTLRYFFHPSFLIVQDSEYALILQSM